VPVPRRPVADERLLEEVLGQRAVADAPLEVAQERTVVVDEDRRGVVIRDRRTCVVVRVCRRAVSIGSAQEIERPAHCWGWVAL
jgi:hypothetical protein